jgi:hypothetical protein
VKRLPPESLALAARSLDADHPAVAEFLRSLAAQPGQDRARVERRAALRGIWTRLYPGELRTVAARLIAVEWQAIAGGFGVPEEIAVAYSALAGYRPLAWRAIADDLDPAMD